MSQPTPQPASGNTRRQRILASRAIPKGYVVLGAEDAFLGRGKDCQVVLLADEISRRHARIAWDGGVHTIVDLGSANGTFVNGDATSRPRKLDHDDLISIGPFQLRYLVVEATREDLAARFDPRSGDTVRKESRAAKGKKEALLAGRFTGAVLLEACQLIEVSKRSGALRVEAGGLSGRVLFRDGQIVDARVGIESGEKAARRILGFRQGDYSFEQAAAGAALPSGPIALKPSAIAMDILRTTDESLEKTRQMDRGFLDEAHPQTLPDRKPGPRPGGAG